MPSFLLPKLKASGAALLGILALTTPLPIQAGGYYSVLQRGSDGVGTRPTGVVVGASGFLYGFYQTGGASWGTLFRLDPRDITDPVPNGTLFQFSPQAGVMFPSATPALASDGRLYGIGSTNKPPTYETQTHLFRIDLNGTGLTVIYTFDPSFFRRDGFSRIIEGADKRLYIKCSGGILAIARDGSNPKVILTTTPPHPGAIPDEDHGDFFAGRDGRLYGVINSGDPYQSAFSDRSTAFSMDVNGGDFRSIKVIHPNTIDSLFEGRDGRLYGIASSENIDESDNPGMIFSVHRDGSNFRAIRKFTSAERYQSGYLVEGSDGRLYLSNYRALCSMERSGADFRVDREREKGEASGYPLIEVSPLNFVGVESYYPGLIYQTDVSFPDVVPTPKNPITTAHSFIRISGRAYGTIRKVEFSDYRGGYRKAKGTKKWHFSAPLREGRNVFRVRAVSSLGGKSRFKTVQVFRKSS